MKWALLLILSSAIFSQCNDAYVFEEDVEEEMIDYFKSFAVEGEERGRVIDWDLERIATNLIDINEDAVGRCLTYEDGSKVINIDRVFWNNSTDLEKEFLIYHELGHCLLERSHTNVKNQRGVCQSIMNSGENLCTINYNQNTRNRYLDELFL